MRIYHNVPALNAYNNLQTTTNMTAKSLEKLSSGLRINRAADDAAGLAISEKMRGQIRGLNQAVRNAQDGISLIQTAEGALNETHSILQRMRELAVQAANDTYTMNDRMEIQKEIDQLKDEINRIANTTEFNTKKLLDGSAAALVSSDKLETKIIMRDGLRVVDQFGQKSAGGGNYKLEITATPGVAQVQKTDIFKIKHGGDSVQQLDINTDAIGHLSADNLAYGKYVIDTAQDVTTATINTGVAVLKSGGQVIKKGVSNNNVLNAVGLDAATATNTANASLRFTVINVDDSATVDYQVDYYVYNDDGTIKASGTVTLNDWKLSAITAGLEITAGTTIITLSGTGAAANQTTGLTTGDVGIYNIGKMIETGDVVDEITFKYDYDIGTADNYTTLTAAVFRFTDDALNNKTNAFKVFTVQYITADTDFGTSYTSTISLTFNGLDTTNDAVDFVYGAGLGKVASLDTKLEDIDKFWDASGNFLLKDPKSITLIQGDGKQTSITLFSTDTIKDVRDKINAAIATGLGQKDYVTGAEQDKFVSYVTKASTDASNTLEKVEGTFVIRSLIAGDNGKINFIGDEALINALSLTTIQNATENKFQVDVTDAHTGTYVAQDVNIAGNLLVGTVHRNVDVMFDPNAGIRTSWDATKHSWDLAADTTQTYTTYVHLADNTQVFQIGANEKQDMSAAIGRMDALALGVNNVTVTDRESAGRSITKLDGAIARVSSQRSSLGAVQNRLDHTINNLNVAAENLTASESRVRDVDMAQEMMSYTKWNILSQAGTAMLAQANMRPQMVLQLLG